MIDLFTVAVCEGRVGAWDWQGRGRETSVISDGSGDPVTWTELGGDKNGMVRRKIRAQEHKQTELVLIWKLVKRGLHSHCSCWSWRGGVACVVLCCCCCGVGCWGPRHVARESWQLWRGLGGAVAAVSQPRSLRYTWLSSGGGEGVPRRLSCLAPAVAGHPCMCWDLGCAAISQCLN